MEAHALSKTRSRFPVMDTSRSQPGARLRRLTADYEALRDLAHRSDLIAIVPHGDPPERYTIRYTCAGLVRDGAGDEPRVISEHEMEIYLHRDYPRRPPQIVWRTGIFHPNILSYERNGTVCIGAWFPSQSLADLVVRIGAMVQYKEYNTQDALDIEAAVWAQRNRDRLPIDKRPLVR
jgi:ubiquitin-protein ligase